MPAPQPVQLSETDHARLCVFPQRGKANVRTLQRAQVLLKLDADAGWTTAAIAAACDVNPNTVGNVRKMCATSGS